MYIWQVSADLRLILSSTSFLKSPSKKFATKEGGYQKMPKIDTLDALEEHEEYDDDYQTNSN